MAQGSVLGCSEKGTGEQEEGKREILYCSKGPPQLTSGERKQNVMFLAGGGQSDRLFVQAELVTHDEGGNKCRVCSPKDIPAVP